MSPEPEDRDPASESMSEPTPAQLRRWRRYLADERLEGAVYRSLAKRRDGEIRAILLGLADAERRHEDHWRQLLGDRVGRRARPSLQTRILAALARRFGSVFVLALAQRAESRSPYETEAFATPAMAADERVHAEVVRGLAAQGRNRLSGTFRAAVFGANDGLVSNLALVLGIGATGVSPQTVLFTGVAGLLAGALSMGAGEYVSVSSQRELLASSAPGDDADEVLPRLDVDSNELALVYRARGMSEPEAARRAQLALAGQTLAAARRSGQSAREAVDDHEIVGSALGAAVSSFLFFASGAVIPVLPYAFGLTGLAAIITAAALVGVALLFTGGVVGVLSGSSPMRRGFRQLAIGYGAAAVTYLLGLAFGTVIG